MTDFPRAFDLVVAIEGGYVNDPRDPGGETIHGITRRDHPDLWERGPPTLEQARDRYQSRYWEPCRCGLMPWPVNLVLFDAAVNQGPEPAIRMLQSALGVIADGIVGRQTLAAIQSAQLGELVPRYLARRARRYVGTRNFDLYGEGWFFRLFRLASSLPPLQGEGKGGGG
jgi:lysozyme family protein